MIGIAIAIVRPNIARRQSALRRPPCRSGIGSLCTTSLPWPRQAATKPWLDLNEAPFAPCILACIVKGQRPGNTKCTKRSMPCLHSSCGLAGNANFFRRSFGVARRDKVPKRVHR